MEFPLEKFYDFEEDLRLKIYYIGSSQGHLRPVEVQLLSEPSGLTKKVKQDLFAFDQKMKFQGDLDFEKNERINF